MSMAQVTLQHKVRNVDRLQRARLLLTFHSDIIIWIELISSGQSLAIFVIFTVHFIAVLVVKHWSLTNDGSVVVLIVGDRLV